MTTQQIVSLKPALSRFVAEFADCFPKFDTRSHLKDYVQGQLSDLPRKSVEPMAHLAQVPPRTLQEFFSLSDWDPQRLRERIQQIVARDHECSIYTIGLIMLERTQATASQAFAAVLKPSEEVAPKWG